MKRKLLCEIFLHLIILFISIVILKNKTLYIYIQMVSPILNPVLYLYITLMLCCYLILDILKNKYKKQLLIIYIIFLLITLFWRPFQAEFRYSKIFYLKTWVEKLFQNKIIFLNVIGNIVLYMPLCYLCFEIKTSNSKRFLFCLVFIIILEIIQFLLKVGVFDLIDILLNIIGVFLVMLVR